MSEKPLTPRVICEENGKIQAGDVNGWLGLVKAAVTLLH